DTGITFAPRIAKLRGSPPWAATRPAPERLNQSAANITISGRLRTLFKLIPHSLYFVRRPRSIPIPRRLLRLVGTRPNVKRIRIKKWDRLRNPSHSYFSGWNRTTASSSRLTTRLIGSRGPPCPCRRQNLSNPQAFYRSTSAGQFRFHEAG